MQGTNTWITFSEFRSYTNYPYLTNPVYNDSITWDLAIFPISYIDTTSVDTTTIDTSSLTTINFDKDIIIYPNPVKDKLNIKSKYLVQDIDIFDTRGKMVASKDIRSFKWKIDISYLPKGSYIVCINTINGSVKKKLIIE